MPHVTLEFWCRSSQCLSKSNEKPKNLELLEHHIIEIKAAVHPRK